MVLPIIILKELNKEMNINGTQGARNQSEPHNLSYKINVFSSPSLKWLI